jgi:hypothetical protein
MILARFLSLLAGSNARACAVCFGLTHDNRGLILGITVGIFTLAGSVFAMMAFVVRLVVQAERERSLRGS